MIENFIDRFVPSKDEREFLKDKSVTFSDVEQAEIIINHECLKNSEKKQAVQELKETISDKELITDLNKAIDEIPDSENCWHESGMKCFYRKFDIPHNFRHGDIVRVVDGKHEGNIGVILGLTDEEYEKLKVKKGDYSDIQICVDVIFRGYDYLGEFSHSHVNPIYIERIQLPESDARKHYIDYLVETYDKQYLSDYNTATDKEKIKQRIHILSAVMWAQEHHNQIMYLVDSSKDKACFQEMLMEYYNFDREQACAISDMRMSVYIALEKDRTKKEIQELLMKM